MERDDCLSELHEGKACEILERRNDKSWAKETCCVGVRWDLCPKRDLWMLLAHKHVIYYFLFRKDGGGGGGSRRP